MLGLRSCSVLSLALAASVGLSTAPARAEGPAPCGSRWIAVLPFGAGQFQNRDVGLGIFFAAGEAALAGTSIATTLVVDKLASTNVFAPGPRPSIARLNDQLRTVTVVNRMAFAGWAALTAVGLIEAQVSFGPRRADEKSAPPSLAVAAASVPGGGMVGLHAAF
jgi:hypothetical protein